MLSGAACRTKKRLAVLFVLLEVLLVFYATTRLFLDPHDRSSSTARHLAWARNGSDGESLHDGVPWNTSRSGSHGTYAPPVVVGPAAHNQSPALLASFDVDRLVERVQPRAFPLWNNLTVNLPCPRAVEDWTSPGAQKAATRAGILYVKVAKTGSSTGASVNLRLASRLYQKAAADAASSPPSSDGNRTQSLLPPPVSASSLREHRRVCRNRFKHWPANAAGYGQRNRARSVLWSVVRDPTDRLVSEYFHFYVSRGGFNATDDSAFRRYLKENRERLPSFQARYLAFEELAHAGDNVTADDLNEERRALGRSAFSSQDSGPLSSPSPSPHPAVSVDTIRSILGGYDFVGVSERMDESLVALQLLLGLETEDVLHIRYAKSLRQVQDARTGVPVSECRTQSPP
jgi:Sulfotransferase family